MLTSFKPGNWTSSPGGGEYDLKDPQRSNLGLLQHQRGLMDGWGRGGRQRAGQRGLLEGIFRRRGPACPETAQQPREMRTESDQWIL